MFRVRASHQLPSVLGEMSPAAAAPKPATKGPRPAGRTEEGPLMAWEKRHGPETASLWRFFLGLWKTFEVFEDVVLVTFSFFGIAFVSFRFRRFVLDVLVTFDLFKWFLGSISNKYDIYIYFLIMGFKENNGFTGIWSFMPPAPRDKTHDSIITWTKPWLSPWG